MTPNTTTCSAKLWKNSICIAFIFKEVSDHVSKISVLCSLHFQTFKNRTENSPFHLNYEVFVKNLDIIIRGPQKDDPFKVMM